MADGEIHESTNYVLEHFPDGSDRLVVVFVSAGQDGVGEPIKEFRSSLSKFPVSVAFLTERKPLFYNYGDTISMFQRTARLADRYARVATIGESMGGSGAIVFNKFTDRIDRILAFSPMYSVAPPYANFAGRTLPPNWHEQNFWSFAEPKARDKAQILYGNRDWTDHVHSGMFLVDGFSVHFIDGSGHLVARRLKEAGRLEPLLASFLDFTRPFSAASVAAAVGDLKTSVGAADSYRLSDFAEQHYRNSQLMGNPVRLPPPDGLFDLALGCRTDQSSVSRYSRGKTTKDDSARAVAGRLTGGYAFHTDEEDQPWWRVDLGRTVSVRELRIYNRIDALTPSNRGLTFAVEVRNADDEAWVEVFRKDDQVRFGGADGMPFQWRPERPIVTRHLRIRHLGRSMLHYDAIEVFGEAA